MRPVGRRNGFIAGREGGFEWTVPSDELFGFHLAKVSELGGYLLGRKLYETMLVWEAFEVPLHLVCSALAGRRLNQRVRGFPKPRALAESQLEG